VNVNTWSRPDSLVAASYVNFFFQLVSCRYEWGAILLISNRSVGEWGSIFSDTVVATAILFTSRDHNSRRQLPLEAKASEP